MSYHLYSTTFFALRNRASECVGLPGDLTVFFPKMSLNNNSKIVHFKYKMNSQNLKEFGTNILNEAVFTIIQYLF